MTADDETAMRDAVGSNSLQWQALKTRCDAQVNTPVREVQPNLQAGNILANQSNGPFAYNLAIISPGYETGDWTRAIAELSLCYVATIKNAGFSNQTRAAAYGAKAKDILMAASVPAPRLYRDIPVSPILVKDGVGTIVTPHGVTVGCPNGSCPGWWFTIEGSGSPDLDGDQQVLPSVTSLMIKFSTRAADGVYVPSRLRYRIFTDAVPHATSMLRIVSGSPTRIDTVQNTVANGGSVTWLVGSQVRVAGLTDSWAGMNGTWTVTKSAANTTLWIDYSSSSTQNSIPLGATVTYPAQPLQFYLPNNISLRVGDLIDVEGIQGCPEANGTWRVSSLTKPMSVTKPDGSPAPSIDGTCSSNAPLVSSDFGYHLRHLPRTLAMGYSWLAPLLSDEEKRRVRDKAVEQWKLLSEYPSSGNWVHPLQNYYTSSYTSFVQCAAAFGADTDPRLKAFIDQQFTLMRDYYNAWAAQGGYPQGLRDYGWEEIKRIYTAALAEYKAGVDWSAAPYDFRWLNGTMQYLFGFVTPDGSQLEDYGYVSTLGGTTTPYDVEISQGATLPMAAWANAVGHPDAARMSQFHFQAASTVQGLHSSKAAPIAYTNAFLAGIRSEEWMDFLLQRDSWPQADWTPKEPTYYGLSGDYAVTRTAWNDPNAVYVTLMGNIFIDHVPQGKQKMKLGEITVRRGGTKRLVGTAEGFVARHNAKAVVDELHNTDAYSNQTWMKLNRFYNGLWAAAPGGFGGSQNFENWCVGGSIDRNSRLIPGMDATILRMDDSARPRIDLRIDAVDYVYWRAPQLECYYTLGSKYSSDLLNHVQSWTREVLTLRPQGVVVVRDRTTVRTPNDEYFINWVVPQGGAMSTTASDNPLARFTVSNAELGGDIGAITFVTPDRAAVTQTDCVRPLGESYKSCDRLEVRPAEGSSSRDNEFVTVIDASGDLGNLATVERRPATGGTAVEISGYSAVVFATAHRVTYTLSRPGERRHVISGLTPDGKYWATNSGQDYTVSRQEGGLALTADSAGTVSFTTGPDGAVLDPAQSAALFPKPILRYPQKWKPKQSGVHSAKNKGK
ncbi:hypothetical protein [Paludibaculum fermentans]|uniref:hypothetical protein n=1 Tax=Paludibaculum fermentans TaxID=1473598 RepID=UPI003EB72BB9